MKYLKAVVLGLTQGVTEFLPVSSSGHLALLEGLGFAPSDVFLNLTLHVATLAAVLIVMRREVWGILRHPVRGDGKYVLLSSLPTVGIALLFEAFCPALLTGRLLAFGFLCTAALLFLSEKFSRDRGSGIGVGNSLITGAMQGFAVLPGLSRSGATIAALRLSGVPYERAAAFSFLLSVPVIAGGFLFEGVKTGFSVQGADFGAVAVAAVAAFLSGLFAARFMLSRVKKMTPFALYTLALGVLCFFVV